MNITKQNLKFKFVNPKKKPSSFTHLEIKSQFQQTPKVMKTLNITTITTKSFLT